MNKLKKNTFITIFLIFTAFLVIITVFTNIQNYNREYNNIKNNLLRINNIFFRPGKKDDFENKIIMDYEIYTVTYDSNKNIVNVFTHTNETTNFDINKVATQILSNVNKNGYKINNLYFSNYAYKLDNESLTVINTKVVKERLINYLLLSFGLFTILELMVLFITKIITNYLTKPAIESFNKQKEFIADASHELKTPLAVIMASSDELNVSKNNEKYLNNIKNESERMNKLITSLLDLSKLENGVNKDNFREFNLSKIINKACLTFESIAFENEVMISSNIKDDVIFNGNEDEIYEVISILLDNAIKHSYKKSTINVNLNIKKNNIIIEVINTGDPIKKEEEEKIFERFYRSDKSRNRNSNRYGLGLAIAKNIVNNHNGIINAKSIDNKTIFTINFKIK